MQEAATGSLLTDEEVIARVRAGETELYEILMRRHNRRLYRVILSILKNQGETEEVMQEAYVRAYEHLDRFEGRSSFATWLTRIAIHEAFGRMRFRKRFVEPASSDRGKEPMEQFESNENNPEELYLKRKIGDVLEDLLKKLPEKYRLVFVMREVEGLSTRETASCLGIEEEAVKTRLFRARALLRRGLNARTLDAARDLFHFGGERCDRVVYAVMTRIRS